MRKRILTALTAAVIVFSGGLYLGTTPAQAAQSSCLEDAISVYNAFVETCSGTADCTFQCSSSGELESASCTCE